MSRCRHRLEIALSPEQLETLTIESERLGKPKASLVREWAFESTTPATAPPGAQSRLPRGRHVYAQAVEAACRSYSGLPRSQMEAIVSAVIISLENA
jgi:hypothetical protein